MSVVTTATRSSSIALSTAVARSSRVSSTADPRPPAPSKRARFHAVDVALEVLADEVVVDETLVGVGEALGDGAPHLVLRPDLHAVDLGHGTDAQRRGGQEHLLRVVGV